ncbi:MAG TPA: CBS domain-containing protein, partial [Acidimicrobiia bacterium]
LGWVDQSEVDGSPLASLPAKPFAVTLRPESSLREAIDAVVTSHARVAVVVDDDQRYLGMVGLESIAEEITQ